MCAMSENVMKSLQPDVSAADVCSSDVQGGWAASLLLSASLLLPGCTDFCKLRYFN